MNPLTQTRGVNSPLCSSYPVEYPGEEPLQYILTDLQDLFLYYNELSGLLSKEKVNIGHSHEPRIVFLPVLSDAAAILSLMNQRHQMQTT